MTIDFGPAYFHREGPGLLMGMSTRVRPRLRSRRATIKAALIAAAAERPRRGSRRPASAAAGPASTR